MVDSALFSSPPASPDILVMTRTFLPDAGGIEDYVYTRCLQDPKRTVVLTAGCKGDDAFDAEQPFSIHRWAELPPLKLGALDSILKQILYMFWELVGAIRLYGKYRYRSIEWCHGYDFPVLLLLSYLLPIRCFMYLHGNDLLCPLQNPVLRLLFAWTLRRMDAIVCNSSFTKSYLQKHFELSIPIYVVNPTVRTEKFGPAQNTSTLDKSSIRQTYGIPEQSIVLLSVGRLVPRKGFDTVIKLLPKLLEANIDVHYLICGKGKQQEQLKALTKQLDLANRVHFAGYVPDDQLASHYEACDIFTLLTFFNESAKSIEGYGIVYTEAGYFGKPVVACRVGGVVDAVKDNENGLLVAPDNPEEILEALIKLCQDSELREQLGAQGKVFASQGVSYDFITPRQEAA